MHLLTGAYLTSLVWNAVPALAHAVLPLAHTTPLPHHANASLSTTCDLVMVTHNHTFTTTTGHHGSTGGISATGASSPWSLNCTTLTHHHQHSSGHLPSRHLPSGHSSHHDTSLHHHPSGHLPSGHSSHHNTSLHHHPSGRLPSGHLPSGHSPHHTSPSPSPSFSQSSSNSPQPGPTGSPPSRTTGTGTGPNPSSNTSSPYNFGTPTLYTTSIIVSGTTKLVPVLSGGSLSTPVSLSPAPTTLPATAFTSSASSASSQIVGLFPIISKWKDDTAGLKGTVLSDIKGVTSDIEGLLSESGGSSSGGCPSSKRKRALRQRSLLGDVVNDITGDLECAVEGLTKMTASIEADDIPEVDSLVDGLTDVADDIGKAEDDDDNNSSSKDSSSSKDHSSSGSSSCSAKTASRVTSDCLISTFTTDGTTTSTTTCTSSTTVETTGCSVTPTTTTVFASSSSSVSAPPFCASTNCGDSCPLNPGPLTSTMNIDGSEDCAAISTITTDSLPSATAGLWGTVTSSAAPASGPPLGSASAAPTKRSELYTSETELHEAVERDLQKRALPNVSPEESEKYVAGLKPVWISQAGLTDGTWFPFDAQNRQVAGVNGIYGCTGVFVISQKGVYIAHIWENPGFIKEVSKDKYQLVDAETFKSTTSAIMLAGNQYTPSLTGLQGTAGNPGPLALVNNPQIIIVTPYDDPYGRKVLGLTGLYRYTNQANQIATELENGLKTGKTPRVVGYRRTDQKVSTAKGYKGRAIIQYDPYQQYVEQPKRGNQPRRTVQLSKWRLWVEEDIVEEAEYYVNTNPSRNTRRTVGSCPAPFASGSASASHSGSSSNGTHPSGPSASHSASSSNGTHPGGPITSHSATPSGSPNPASATASSSTAAAPYCVPFQNPDDGVKGYCQCSGGADYSFASGSNPCPYTSPGPANMSITDTGTLSSKAPPPPSSSSFSPTPSTSSRVASGSASGSISGVPFQSGTAKRCSIPNTPVCQTSSGSPLISDCKALSIGSDSLCAQPYGSGCQTITTSGSCQLVFCQPDDALGPSECLASGDPCVEYWINELVSACGSNGDVGGYISIPPHGGGSGYLNLEFVHS